MKQLLESVFGANWRTTLSGWITIAFAAIILQPSLLDFLGETWEKRIVGFAKFCAVISGGAFASATKDRVVTGNGTLTDPARVNDGNAVSRIVSIVLLCLFLPACETASDGTKQLTPQARAALDRAEQVVGQAALAAADAAAQNAAQQAISNHGSVDGSEVASAAEFAALGAGIRAATAPTASAIAQSASNYTTTPGAPPPIIAAVAPVASTAIHNAVSAGAPLALAQEAAARGADSAAKSITQP